MRNPRTPSRRLTLRDAVVIWLLRLEGHFQHRIAAMLDVNQGTVNKVLKGRRFPEARALALRVEEA